MQRVFLTVLLAFGLLVPACASAWWHKDWPYRVKVAVDAGAAAAGVIPVRLTVANFPFADAHPDGDDLRFVAEDDKTPLPFHIESYDSAENLAIVWVRMPTGAQAPRTVWMYYGNPDAAPAGDSRATYGPEDAAVFHFAEREGTPRDAAGIGHAPLRFSGRLGAAGVAGAGLGLSAADALVLPGAALDFTAARGWAFTTWIRPTAMTAAPAAIFSLGDDVAESFSLALLDGRLVATATAAGKATRVESTVPVVAGRWQHVGVSVSDRIVLYVDGIAAGSAPAPRPAPSGDLHIGAHPVVGAGLAGEIDALHLAGAARSAAWMASTFAVQQPDSVSVALGGEEQGGGADAYIAVLRALLGSVSRDGWVIIGLIAVLGFVSVEVMVGKLLLLRRIDRSNAAFLARFRSLSGELTALAESEARRDRLHDSSLFAMYDGGVAEYRRQAAALDAAGAGALTAERLEVIKATIDTAIVEQSQRMNRWMVLLTVAVSAAPFLGLLGTVVGIMVTFGAIALAGDVNVNTIAPGVGAALATTVTGLAVAIPVMFGYNYLASRIRDLTATMEVFANELLGRLALARSAQ